MPGPVLSDAELIGVLQRYLGALALHPSAESMLGAIVTTDFTTGFVDGHEWHGPAGLADFLGQRAGFFDELHVIDELLERGEADGDLEARTQLHFFLRRWDGSAPTSDEFTGSVIHRWRVRSVDGGWRVAAQIVERFLDLNENSERLFAVPEVGLNPSVVASGDGGPGFSLVSIDNIGVSAVNRQRSVAFYELLGLSRVGENDRGTTMSAGNAKIFVFETSGGSQGQTTRSLALFDNAPGLDHISLEVDDVDRAYASLRAAGVAFASEPETYDWGARAVATRDPDGTTVFLLQWVAD